MQLVWMNDLSHDRVQQGGEFTADLAISFCTVWPGAWDRNLPLILCHPLNKSMHCITQLRTQPPKRKRYCLYHKWV